MSLILQQGTKPDGLYVKTFDAEHVQIGDYELSMEDFCSVVIYVLGNTNLKENDPRETLLSALKGFKKVPGWGEGKGKRLSIAYRTVKTGRIKTKTDPRLHDLCVDPSEKALHGPAIVKRSGGMTQKGRIEKAAGKDGRRLMEEYSGRYMYGKTCLAIVCDDPNAVIAEVGIKGAKLDSMGKEFVVYWPNVTKDGIRVKVRKSVLPEE